MSSRSQFFTVCKIETAIEMRVGCYESPQVRVICTCHSYDAAQQVAQIIAKLDSLPLIDYAQASAQSDRSEEQGI